LQYVEVTLVFMEHVLMKAVDVKLIFSIFEKLTGLDINFHKSEIFGSIKPKEKEHVKLIN
jgi:hypothetical protein